VKKFVVFLLLILILSVAAFFAGWVGVPPGSVALVTSKTHGSTVVEPGGIHWLWFRLIPTNAKTTVFTIKAESGYAAVKGRLPKADTYASFVGLNANFEFEADINYIFSVKAAELPAIVSGEGLADQAALDAYCGKISDALGSFIEQRIVRMAADGGIFEAVADSGTSPDTEDAAAAAFPKIDNISLHVVVVKLPDYALYESAGDRYASYMARIEELLRPDAVVEAERRVTNQFRIDELSRFGELFLKYPMLLNYLDNEKR
jgi:hypothetical protein